MKLINEFLTREAALLYEESLAHRFLSWTSLFRSRPLDDSVGALKTRPLGMFFYNQRAIFLIGGVFYLVALWVLSWHFRSVANHDTLIWTTGVLTAFYVFDVVVTFILHPSFVQRIRRWAASPVAYKYPVIFDRYFLFDSLLVLALIAVGKMWQLKLDVFISLVFANTVVYSSAYIRGGSQKRRQIAATLLFVVITVGFLAFGTKISIEEPRPYFLVLNLSVLAGMCLMTVLSVSMISWLRTIESDISDTRLGLLGRFERMLSESSLKRDATDKSEPRYSETQFRNKVRDVLRALCELGPPFWYDSACLWLFENHQDRGRVLLPAASVRFEEAAHFREGLDNPDSLLMCDDVYIVHSLKQHAELEEAPLFRSNLNAPAAFVPLMRDDKHVGVLALYGRETGASVLHEEKTFLWTLASILCNSMEQWEGRYRVLPQEEMDELFGCESLNAMFSRAVKILNKYLEASGCMLIFRADPNERLMRVRAVAGLGGAILNAEYIVGVGQTGKCAEDGKPIKWDNVRAHLDSFDAEHLHALERSLGSKVVSWMAIPIGGKNHNFGVIKVVNSRLRCPWFTTYDQELGIDLSQRLEVMIEKFLHIAAIEYQLRAIEDAKEEAQQHASTAERALSLAEQTAKQRQEDLMIITHQLQGPLNSVIGAITLLQRRSNDERLQYVHDLVEDALALCFGTFTTFGSEAGRETAFGSVNINAPAELRKLAKRLQSTNARQDLKFVYKEEAGFPILKMDWGVFTSVLYSLIHNAMKYAEDHSTVTLECSFERSFESAALKVRSFGEPIKPHEKEKIFEKYIRGEVVGTTGRHHSGVGLGLWVARELMKAIGGNLTVELSEHTPELSVFVVHIPQQT